MYGEPNATGRHYHEELKPSEPSAPPQPEPCPKWCGGADIRKCPVHAPGGEYEYAGGESSGVEAPQVPWEEYVREKRSGVASVPQPSSAEQWRMAHGIDILEWSDADVDAFAADLKAKIAELQRDYDAAEKGWKAANHGNQVAYVKRVAELESERDRLQKELDALRGTGAKGLGGVEGP